MSLTSRGARAAARSLRLSPSISQRRYASHGGDHHDDHGSGESAFHVAEGPANESFGRGFYIALAVAPVSYLAYTLATDDKNFVRRYLDQYQSQRELDAHRNNLHTQMMEEAVQDRSLFKYSPRDVSGPDLRYPEQLNHGSPVNVVAGQGAANLEDLVEYYEERRKLEDEGKIVK